MDDIVLTSGDRAIILAGLFELCVARFFEDRELIDRVADLVLRLGGDPDERCSSAATGRQHTAPGSTTTRSSPRSVCAEPANHLHVLRGDL